MFDNVVYKRPLMNHGHFVRSLLILKSITMMQVWHHFVVGRNGSGNVYEEGVSGAPKLDLLMALCGVWFLIFLCIHRGMEMLSKILCFTTVATFLLLCWLLFWFGQWSVVIPQVLKIDLKYITDIGFWSRGATFSMRMFGFSMGILITLGSYSR